MRAVQIILMCIVAAILYGILHDQVTVGICLEYFTIGHPPLFDVSDPTMLALAWGIVATWWVGLILGVGLALAARAGRWPKRSARELIRPLALIMLLIGALSAMAAVMGHVAARMEWVYLLEPLASRMPEQQHTPFITALWAHLASYIAGFALGLFLCGAVLVGRIREFRTTHAAVGSTTSDLPPIPSTPPVC
jgi:hypothetical protein